MGNDKKELMDRYGTLLVVDGENTVTPISRPEHMLSVILESVSNDTEIRGLFDTVKPMDSGWKESIRSKWWGREEREDGIDGNLYTLRDTLLSFGGEAVCVAFWETEADNILRYGQMWHGFHIIRKRGAPNRCHQNAMTEALRNGKYRFATGYALSDDGMWRQHSWCVVKKNGVTRVVETTEPRVMYFGFIPDDGEFYDMLCSF